jgi:hypothetical protein
MRHSAPRVWLSGQLAGPAPIIARVLLQHDNVPDCVCCDVPARGPQRAAALVAKLLLAIVQDRLQLVGAESVPASACRAQAGEALLRTERRLQPCCRLGRPKCVTRTYLRVKSGGRTLHLVECNRTRSLRFASI